MQLADGDTQNKWPQSPIITERDVSDRAHVLHLNWRGVSWEGCGMSAADGEEMEGGDAMPNRQTSLGVASNAKTFASFLRK